MLSELGLPEVSKVGGQNGSRGDVAQAARSTSDLAGAGQRSVVQFEGPAAN